MKSLFIFGIICLSQLIQPLHAQRRIAVQNGGAPALWTDLDSAVLNAQSGDTIYIPGGSFQVGNLLINKKLHLVGAGHDPDSTSATWKTELSGGIKLGTGADGGSITGVELSSTIEVDTSNGYVLQGYTIARNHLWRIDANGRARNLLIFGNVVEAELVGYVGYSFGPISPYAEDNVISNNILQRAVVGWGAGTLFANNIFLYNTYNPNNNLRVVQHTKECIFQNNYIKQVGYGGNISGTNNIIRNNILHQNTAIAGQENLIGVHPDSIFVAFPSNNTFGYADDYHIKPNSPAKNAGFDGTDVGIYGGLFPWKDGSIPFNPHIQSATVGPTTDGAGNLPVNIKVSAQDN